MPEDSKQPIFRSQDVPRVPGVYVYRNSGGEVIYVGKARNLRSRMSSYFRPSGAMQSDPRRRALIHSIASYEIFPVETEQEALLLEDRFIKQYNPRYNVDLRDDKRYLHVAIDPTETFPRLQTARLRREDARYYFGPFPWATALRTTIRFLEVRYGLRSCPVAEPCPDTKLHCHEDVIRDCLCPCVGKVTPEEYHERQKPITLMNVTRKILEYYFLQLCGYDGAELRKAILVDGRPSFFDEFGNEDKEQFDLAQSMLAYISPERIGFNDGLHYVEESADPDVCKAIFKKIFEIMKQGQHYKMMYAVYD